jgi:hypothetical protein
MSLAARFRWPVGRAGYEYRANDRCVAARTSVSSADEVLELLLGLADPAGSASVGFSCRRSAGVAARTSGSSRQR